MVFRYVKFTGRELNPRRFGEREPTLEEVYRSYVQRELKIDAREYIMVRIRGEIVSTNKVVDETLWLDKNTYDYAKNVLGPKKIYYEAHEGVTFTAAKGAWVVLGQPEPVQLPGCVSCVRVQTQLSRELNIGPFIIERDYVFKGFKGEDIEVGYIKSYRYFIAAYNRNGSPLSEKQLASTLLWRNYIQKIINTIQCTSKHLKKMPWHLERMKKKAFAKYKVVWRDVAKEFIPAVVDDGAVPDYTVNYIVTSSLEEAHYLLAILLAPQINAVVRELSPWIGHVQPRFIRYFKIPKYDPKNRVHRELTRIGKEICSRRSIGQSQKREIEDLVEKL
ncbi:MAG TPA: hypothetical protein EYH08_04935 [Pyrodictium sp.]|nr:hypothetical protein [Pyrodictium sp.]